MQDTLLLVGHGSRAAGGNDEIEQFAARWRERHPGWHIEVGFIEFADVLLDEGLDRAARAARAGTGRVLVLPLILNAAGHVKGDIPRAIEAASQRHAGVRFDQAPHLGAGEPILTVLRRKLRHAMHRLDVPDPRSTGVVLLGRGSSDRKANGEVAKMARWLWEEGDHELVDIAFTGITHPRLERVVQRQVTLGMTQVVVLPYYLFTGTLMERIDRQMGHLARQYPGVRFAHASYFGFEPEIFALLDERVDRWQRGAPHATVRHDHHLYAPHSHDHGADHDHGPDHAHDHSHEHAHGHDHDHDHDHAHGHDHVHAHGSEGHGHDHDHDHAHGAAPLSADDGNDAARHCTHRTPEPGQPVHPAHPA